MDKALLSLISFDNFFFISFDIADAVRDLTGDVIELFDERLLVNRDGKIPLLLRLI